MTSGSSFSSRLGDGIGAIFASWPPYVLIVAGAATMVLASRALAAGPLAASQPGFTILDPLSAGLLGMFLFSEHIQAAAPYLAGEAAALAVVIAGAGALSHSQGPGRGPQAALGQDVGVPEALHGSSDGAPGGAADHGSLLGGYAHYDFSQLIVRAGRELTGFNFKLVGTSATCQLPGGKEIGRITF